MLISGQSSRCNCTSESLILCHAAGLQTEDCVRIDGSAVRESHLVWTDGFSSWAVIVCWRVLSLCLYTSFLAEAWCPQSSSWHSQLAICERNTYWISLTADTHPLVHSNQIYSRTYYAETSARSDVLEVACQFCTWSYVPFEGKVKWSLMIMEWKLCPYLKPWTHFKSCVKHSSPEFHNV